MTSRDFCYWLQGFFEVGGTETVSAEQVRVIKSHLAMVFEHEIDPSIDKGDPVKRERLDAIHNPMFPPRIMC